MTLLFESSEPPRTVGNQIAEVPREHEGLSQTAALWRGPRRCWIRCRSRWLDNGCRTIRTSFPDQGTCPCNQSRKQVSAAEGLRPVGTENQ